MSTYDVTVHREDDYWVGVVTGVRGGATEARTLEGLRVEVTDLLAGLLDVSEDDLALRWHYTGELGAIASRLEDLAETRARAQAARSDYEQVLRETVRAMSSLGLSRRDTSSLVGVSHQRVQQLVS